MRLRDDPCGDYRMKRPCACDKCDKGQPWTNHQCRLCWLFHNDERYARLWSEPHQPTILERVDRVSKAVRKWIAAGSPVRTAAELSQCFAICAGCDKYQPGALPVADKCGQCGCFLSAKARMATEACPLGKWPTRPTTTTSPPPTE